MLELHCVLVMPGPREHGTYGMNAEIMRLHCRMGYMQAGLWQAVRYRGAKRRFPHHLDRKREMTNIPYLNKEQALLWIYGLRCLFENQ